MSIALESCELLHVVNAEENRSRLKENDNPRAISTIKILNLHKVSNG